MNLKELFIDFNFTHSLTTDIFNFCQIGAAKDGKIVTGCMVVNSFMCKSLVPLKNNDGEVFTGLSSEGNNIIVAGKKNSEGDYEVSNLDCDNFVLEMRRKIEDTENISAFGKSI
jgi:hypothetical protein